MKLATKLTWMMFIVLLLVGSSIGFFGYRTAYKQVDEAAGIELVGCANITTGLIDPSDITALIAGDQSKLEAVEDRIGWIVAHKAIFKEAFILSLDGKILAADSSFKARGYKAGDTFISQMKRSTRSLHLSIPPTPRFIHTKVPHSRRVTAPSIRIMIRPSL